MVRKQAVSATLAILLGSATLTAQVTFVPDQTPRVSVDGQASITARPDLAFVSFGVYGLNEDLQTARAGADAAVGRLLKVAEDLKIERDDIAASSLNVEPNYSDDRPHKFLGYGVTRSVNITPRDLARLEDLIDGAVKAGANQDFNIALEVADAAALRERATMLALEDAKKQAARIAAVFGMKLGPVRSISPGSRGVSNASGRTFYAGIPHGTFLPSSVTISADESVTFVLLP
jgi:uncharacterized protein